MSTVAAFSTSIYAELQSFYQNRQTDLKQLGSDLKSGNVSAAEQDFTTLAALGQSGPFADAQPFSNSTRAQSFETIGQDLQAGDLAGAQAAFATLTSKQSQSATSAQATASAVNVNSTTASSNTASGTTASPAGNTNSIYEQLQAYRQERQSDLNQLGQDLQAGNLTAAQQDFTVLTNLGAGGPNKNGQPFQNADREQDFQTIGQALQSGNLSLAQSAYASLAGSFGKQDQQAQAAVSAYNSNAAEIVINLGGASSTGASSGAATTTPEVVINLGQESNSSSSGVSEIVINFGDASGTGASSGSTGSTGGSTSGATSGTTATPELVINLGQGSGSLSDSPSAAPEEITINLGSSNSGPQVSIGPAQGQNSSSAEQLTINLNQQSNNEIILNLLNANAASQTQSSSNALSVSA
jgi:hypothetical protein